MYHNNNVNQIILEIKPTHCQTQSYEINN